MISIITPFYYGNDYIGRLLSSVEANFVSCVENDISLEMIIVNDSPECKIDVDIKQYNFDITIIENGKNVGIHGSRINGIKACQGDYIIMIDQDDVLLKDGICNLWNSINESDVCVGNGLYNRKDTDEVIFKNENVQMISSDVSVICKHSTLIISPGQCLVKKNSIPDIWLNNRLVINGADDELLWLVMRLKNLKFSYSYNLVYKHIDTSSNLSNDHALLATSGLHGIDKLGLKDLMSEREYKNYIRRRRMKINQYKRGGVFKVINYLHYFDLTLYTIYIHRIID